MLVLAIGIISYLLGSIPAGYIAGRLAGIDIRRSGSGNIGATNVMRVLGKRYGYPVFLIDFLKGSLAVWLSIFIAIRAGLSANSMELAGIMAAVCSVIGHSFPVWLKFKGGKGVATSAGALFALMPLVLLIGLIIWGVVFKLTGYVSIASMAAAAALPCVIGIMIVLGRSEHTLMLYFAMALAAVVIVRHRSNLSRLLRGTEPRFKGK
jgi:glycerol-3-phosphate acyltransferase PlsY